MLTEKLEIKRLDFLDVVRDQIDGDKDDAEALFNAEFALMTGELAHLLPAVVRALGGETGVVQQALEAGSVSTLSSSAAPAAVVADDPPF